MTLEINEAEREWMVEWVKEKIALFKGLDNPQHEAVLRLFIRLGEKLEKRERW
jgi:hypothetical protein